MLNHTRHCASLIWLCGSLVVACTFSGSKEKPIILPKDAGAGVDTGVPGLTYTSIRVEPSEATLDLATGVIDQQFRAFGTLNGEESDITDKVVWSTDENAAAIAAPGGLVTATGQQGGLVMVRASSGTSGGTAQLTIRLASAETNPADTDPVPAETQGKFVDAPDDPTLAPELVYPNDGVVLPPNLNRIEVHFRPGPAQNTLFEIAFSSPFTDVRVYTHCVQADLPEGCLFELNGALWQKVAMSNRGRGAVTLSVRGTDDTVAATGTSAQISLVFVKEPLRGAVYYWSIKPNSTTNGAEIMRWDFGNAEQTAPESVIPVTATGNTCSGCHALSQDGKKIVASIGGQDDARVVLWDVAKKAPMVPFPAPTRSQFESWNPDASQYVGVGQAHAYIGAKPLMLYDGNTAEKVGEIPVGDMRPDHPDWSADGSRIAFTFVDPTISTTDQRPQNGGIAYVQKTADGWSEPIILVDRDQAREKNRYYPAIDPESSMVVYNESTCTVGNAKSCNCDTDATARLWMVRLQEGSTPIELARVNAPGPNDTGNTDLTTSYAKWSPFVFTMAEESKMMWMTVSSSRMYGLRPPLTTRGDESKVGTYVWMFALNPNAPDDPSSPPFVLPFQDITRSNHIAQWTTAVPAPIE